MLRYLGLRVLQAIGVLWAAFTISFVVLFLLPSDPVSIAVDSGGGSGTRWTRPRSPSCRPGTDWTSLSSSSTGHRSPARSAVTSARPSPRVSR